jgi:uncharacterized protein (DUF1697 family)
MTTHIALLRGVNVGVVFARAVELTYYIGRSRKEP